MDLLSHALAGAAAGGTVGARYGRLRRGALIGAASALAVDLDYFIHSSDDPLVQIELHRHFTHSLIFIPVGALLMSLVLLPLMRSVMSWMQVYLCALAGWATHWALDVLTGYGVHLFWPFSDQRVALDLVSVVDPAFTLLAGLPVLVGLWRVQPRWFLLAAVIAVGYVGLASGQQQRSEQLLRDHAAAQGHQPEAVLVRPSFGNILLWRGIYRDEDHWHVAALRPRLGQQDRAHQHDPAHLPVFRQQQMLPEIPAGSRIDQDIDRLDRLSDGYLVWLPEARQLGDIRFSALPDGLQPMWGLQFDPNAPDSAPEWFIERSLTPADRARFLEQLRGQ